MKNLSTLALTLVLTLTANVGHAEMTMVDYQANKNGLPMMAYILGINDGMLWANVKMSTQKRSTLYCPPSPLRGADLVHLIDDLWPILSPHLYPEDTSIAVVLVSALIKAYPCK